MALITRACSYSANIYTPINPNEYSSIVVTFSQDQEIIVQKNKNNLEISDSFVRVNLTQEETKAFRPSGKSEMGRKTGAPAYMQIRAYRGTHDAPGSGNWAIEVADSLSDEVLGNG